MTGRQLSVADFFSKKKSKKKLNTNLQNNQNIYMESLDEEIERIESNDLSLSASNSVDERQNNSVIYDHNYDASSNNLNTVVEIQSNLELLSQLCDESSSGTVEYGGSNLVICNNVCDNKECIEIKAKYAKIKQAYAKSLTINVSNIEKIHKQETEIAEMKSLNETVS